MSDKVNKVRKPPGRAKFTDSEKIKAIKALQLNGFNYAVTSRQLGISTNSLKDWREKYPQAITNEYNNRNLAIIEHVVKEDVLRITKKSSSLIEKALKQAEMLLEFETDLGKLAGFIRAITPLAKNLQEFDANKGYQQMASLTDTLKRLSVLPGLPAAGKEDIEDISHTEVE